MKCVLFITILFEVTTHFTSARCTSSEWECLNGQCISNSTICDVYPDCSDGSDEINCKDTICSEGQRKCFHSDGNFTCTNSATPCDCGSPGNILYGTATLDDPANSSDGASASVTCYDGYQTSTPNITCQSNGLWTTSRCTAKDCGQLPPISAGSITLVDSKNTTYGASASVTCFTGYQANVTSITCLASGLWESASCTVIDCGQLPPISAGSISLVDPMNTTYGASATVTCFTGYQANVSSVTCLASGLWESASCTIIDCGQLPPISAGSITLVDQKNSTYGASATVACFSGYQANVTSISCLASGLWESARCTIIDCGQLPPLSSGSIMLVDPKNTTYGASATLTCITGYRANVTSVTCLASGWWESASCTIIDCDQLPPISTGSITLVDSKNTTYGANATVTCFTGYQANVTSVKCLASGLWESASCTIIDSIIPVETKEKHNKTTNLIVAFVLGLIFAQLIIAIFLHIKISKYSETGACKGIAVLKIFPCGIPVIGIVFIIKFYWKKYNIYKVAKRQTSYDNENRRHGTSAENFPGNNRSSANTSYSNPHDDAVKLNGQPSCVSGDEMNSEDNSKTVGDDGLIAAQHEYDSVSHTDIELEHHPAVHPDDKRG